MAVSGSMEFPSEINDRLSTLDDSVGEVESIFNTLFGVPYTDLQEKLTSIDKAKLDLVGAYAINSLFWMYLNTKGENPKEHPVKQELDRIRSYMNRVKEMQDKEKAPKINKDASKRFVKSALWKAAHKQASDELPGPSHKYDNTVTQVKQTEGVEKKHKQTESIEKHKGRKNKKMKVK